MRILALRAWSRPYFAELKALTKKGSYAVIITLRKRKHIRIGKLGRCLFPRGTYLYAGSAMNGLGARLSRHLRIGGKKSHWHIDYLLKAPEARIEKIVLSTAGECRLNHRISALPRARVVVKGFGASDCTSACPSHLIYFPPPAKKSSKDYSYK